jgi:amino acid adenylation domain-containing protein
MKLRSSHSDDGSGGRYTTPLDSARFADLPGGSPWIASPGSKRSDMTGPPTLYERYANSAARHPRATALELADAAYDYSELAAAAEETAARVLTAVDGSRPRRIGLMAGRSLQAYAGYLAALRLGAAVVPLSATISRERLIETIGRAGIDVMLAPNPVGGLPVPLVGPDAPVNERWRRTAPTAVNPDDVAYVIHTSGSTGTPKGVPVTHRSAAAMLEHVVPAIGLGPGCRFTQCHELTFDPSVWDLFGTWSAGATLVVPTRNDLVRPARFVANRGITHFHYASPVISVAARLGDLRPGVMPGLRWAGFGGEQLTFERARQWQEAAPNCAMDNLYGPTEATVVCTAYRLPAERRDWPESVHDTVPIGRPLPQVDVLVLDEEGREAQVGELCLRGPQVFSGYLDPQDNDGRFASFDGRSTTNLRGAALPGPEHYYRTGDRVRVSGGLLVHLGRLDQQVKVHGHRIELGQIEAALRRVRGVADAVALALPGDGELVLEACYTGETWDPLELRRQLARMLPGYMVPRGIRHRAAFPLNQNGKTDRRALAEEIAGETRR